MIVPKTIPIGKLLAEIPVVNFLAIAIESGILDFAEAPQEFLREAVGEMFEATAES